MVKQMYTVFLKKIQKSKNNKIDLTKSVVM